MIPIDKKEEEEEEEEVGLYIQSVLKVQLMRNLSMMFLDDAVKLKSKMSSHYKD